MTIILKLTVGKMYSLFEGDPRYYKAPYEVSFWLFEPFLSLTCLIKKQTKLWLRGRFRTHVQLYLFTYEYFYFLCAKSYPITFQAL